MLGRTLAAACVIAALLTTSAKAAVIQDFSGLASATNGIVLGPDGNFWVAEEFSDSVARMTPSGTVLARFPVGSRPKSVATGPGNRVWVSVTGADKLVWLDAMSASPTVHDVPTGLPCGPVAIVAGGDSRMYFSLPDDGNGCGASRIGTVKEDGSDLHTATGLGKVFDLEAYGGKLYAPDYDGDVVRRIGLGINLTAEASIGAPGNPDGIAADGAGNLWVSLNGTGHVGQFSATQNLGTVIDHAPTGDNMLTGAFGIVAGADGRIYVTGKDSHNLARLNADGSFRFYATNSEPFQIVNGPDGDLYFTDQASTRVQRFLSAAPRASTGAATPAAQTVGSATATVDPRGNTTSVVFDYGPTAAYGATSAPVTLPEGAGGVPVTVVLNGLAAGTTYHVRVRASNEEGAATGADTTFTTPPAPPAPPKALTARTSFSWAFVGSRTALRKIDITGLVGGETAKVTCKGKGCPFKSKTYKQLKKGKKSLGSRFGLKRKLAKGAKVEVRITKPGTIGSSAVATIRGRKQDPKIVRSCLKPGATKTSRC
jgi:streptogramin lyase